MRQAGIRVRRPAYEPEGSETIRFEVKSERDSRTHVFIEFEAYGKASGLALTKAEWYAIEVAPHRFVLIETHKLAELVRTMVSAGKTTKGGEGGLATGVAIPKTWLLG